VRVAPIGWGDLDVRYISHRGDARRIVDRTVLHSHNRPRGAGVIGRSSRHDIVTSCDEQAGYAPCRRATWVRRPTKRVGRTMLHREVRPPSDLGVPIECRGQGEGASAGYAYARNGTWWAVDSASHRSRRSTICCWPAYSAQPRAVEWNAGSRIVGSAPQARRSRTSSTFHWNAAAWRAVPWAAPRIGPGPPPRTLMSNPTSSMRRTASRRPSMAA
jgi:hypothetical protein